MRPAEVSDKMKLVQEFYVDYLIKEKLPSEILREKPHLKEAWSFEPAHQYGIPAVYFQQLQDLNLERTWSRVNTPTLVMYGEHDWIMSKTDHEIITDIVNNNNPELAKLVVLPKTDHNFFQHDSLQKGFDDYWSGSYSSEPVELFLSWLKKITT